MAQTVRPPWYHKNISRMKAEELLIKSGVQGSYLIRESESLQNTRVLSLLTGNEVRHFKIVKSQDGKYSLDTAENVQQQFFESLEHLISFYEVQREQLSVPLKLAVPEEGASICSGDDSYDSDFGDDDDDDDDDDDQNTGLNVSRFFLHQLELIKGKSADSKFEEVIESYIRNGLVPDLRKVEMGATKLPRFNAVVVGELQRSLESFTKKLDFVRSLFDVGENDPKMRSRSTGLPNNAAAQTKPNTSAYSSDFEGILNQLTSCKSHIMSLEKKSFQVLKEYSATDQVDAFMDKQETYEVISTTSKHASGISRHRQGICQLFSAYKGNSKTKICISVNTKEGKVSFFKSQEDNQDASNTVDHSNIAQLLKDKSSKTNLGITIGKKTTTYNFEDFKSRELFCHVVERMKNMHSESSKRGRLNQISLFIGTWNMGNTQPPESLSSWFRCQGNGKERTIDDEGFDNPYDIVAIGTQEAGANEKEWVSKIKDVLKRVYSLDYELIARGSLWDIRLVIFVKPSHVNKITTVKQSVVKTGIANKLGNKGAVGISFYFGNTSFCFINAHQQARVERVLKRNQNFHDILCGLNLGQHGVFDITNYFHHLFWFGDLNYRVHSLEIEQILKSIMVNDMDSLLEYDQLSCEKAVGNAFYGFEEEKITFRPTYRYKPGSNNMYVWTKKKTAGNVTNMPSWPDRVLWKTFPEVYITNIAYGSTEDIVTSDHLPVFAAFDVGLLSQSEDIGSSGIKQDENSLIEFLHVEAKIRTSCKTRFILHFCSTCLEAPTESKPNSICDWRDGKKDSKKEGFLHSFPAWRTDDIPKLIPALSNQSYLEDQHIQIAVKGEDGHESYGEFVLSVKRLLRGGTEEIASPLTHLGDESGEIRLMVRATINLPKAVNPVIKNVADLNSIGDPVEQGDSTFPGKDTVVLDPELAGTRRRMTFDTSVHRNYELIGKFANEKEDKSESVSFSAADFNFPIKNTDNQATDTSAAPPIPPKKRLSRQLSSPSATEAQSVNSPDLIWIEDPRTSVSTRNINQASKVDRTNEQYPPVPKRQASLHHHQTAAKQNLPDVPQRQSLVRSSQLSGFSEETPIPKPRSLKSLTKNVPDSIVEWLQRIHLMQYHENLINAGWDDLDYLDFTNHDLEEAGIHIHEHREMLLKSAEVLKSMKLKQQSSN